MKNLHLNLLLVLVLFAPATALNAATDPAQPIDSIEQDSSVPLWHVNLGLALQTEGWKSFALSGQFDLMKGAYASVGGMAGTRKSPVMPNDYRPFLGSGNDSYQLGTIGLGVRLPAGAKEAGVSLEGGLAAGKLKEAKFTRIPPPENPTWFDEIFESTRTRYNVGTEKMNVAGIYFKFKMAWHIDEIIGFEAALTSMFSSEVSYVGLQVGMNIGQLW